MRNLVAVVWKEGGVGGPRRSAGGWAAALFIGADEGEEEGEEEDGEEDGDVEEEEEGTLKDGRRVAFRVVFAVVSFRVLGKGELQYYYGPLEFRVGGSYVP